MARQLTMSDLCAISGYSRHQMRDLLDKIPIFDGKTGEARIAKCYTAHDLLVIAVCCRLETRYGIKRPTVGELSTQLARVLSGPRPVSRAARLLIFFSPLQVSYVEQVDDLSDGLVIALEPVFDQVDDYLLPGRSSLPTMQKELRLGPVGLFAKRPSRVIKRNPLMLAKVRRKGGQ